MSDIISHQWGYRCHVCRQFWMSNVLIRWNELPFGMCPVDWPEDYTMSVYVRAEQPSASDDYRWCYCGPSAYRQRVCTHPRLYLDSFSQWVMEVRADGK